MKNFSKKLQPVIHINMFKINSTTFYHSFSKGT
jgi:hypothetical protein